MAGSEIMKKILRAAQLGLGGSGSGHLSNYNSFNDEGDIKKLVAVCEKV